MKIGTRSVLYGAHQFILHPLLVALGWWQLFGFPWDPRLLLSFIIHDLGYIGKANLDGVEGEQHPEWAGKFMDKLFGIKWGNFCRDHSRFLAKKNGRIFSKLCLADKLAIVLHPAWLYLPMTRLTGELYEYMEGENARTPAGKCSELEWYKNVQQYNVMWVKEHRENNDDVWTGSMIGRTVSIDQLVKERNVE